MKYSLKAICAALLAGTLLLGWIFQALYHWVLYPIWHFRLHHSPRAAYVRDWHLFKKEVQELWLGEQEPLFYPGWTDGLSLEQVDRKMQRHYASYVAYCKKKGTNNSHY
jgi:hypothetical protein